MAAEELYAGAILSHANHPRNFVKLSNPTHTSTASNPVCGDEITVQLRLENNRIDQIGFQGKGCAICIGAASLMTTFLKSKTADAALQARDAFHAFMYGTPNELPLDEAFLAIGSVRDYPVRIKCAMLPWDAFFGCSELIIDKN